MAFRYQYTRGILAIQCQNAVIRQFNALPLAALFWYCVATITKEYAS
jgi:hypothetical protein